MGGDTAESVKNRLQAAGVRFFANDSIGQHLQPGEAQQLEDELVVRLTSVLEGLVIDIKNDHNTAGTARRMARMYVREVFAGRYELPPDVTDFPNSKSLDELYTLGPIGIRTSCSHHFCPVEGDLWCGVVPGERVIGLSKFSRLARWITSRPQIQEEAVVQLADKMEELIKPRGLAVVMKLRHSCMTWRGVREHATTMTTSVTRGIVRESAAARSEFFALIQAQGFACQ